MTAAAAAAAAAATAAQTAATGGGGGTPQFQTDPAATNQFGQAGNDNFLEASDFAASLHDTTGSSSILQVGKLVCYSLVPKESNVTLVPHITLIRPNTLTKCFP